MKKGFLFLLTLGLLGGLLLLTLGEQKINTLQTNIFDLVTQAEEAGMSLQKWESVAEEARHIPRVFPLSNVRNSLLEIQKILQELETLKKNIPSKNLHIKRFRNQSNY